VTSGARSATTVGQSVRLKIPTSAFVNQAVSASLTATPARTGRPVQLQVLASGKWQPLAAGVETNRGAANLSLFAGKAGHYTYRAYLPAWRGAAAAIGASVTVTIKPDQTVPDPDARPLTDAEAAAISDFDSTTGSVALTNPPASAASIGTGDIVMVPPRDGALSGALRRVTKVTHSGSTTTLGTTDANLPQAIDNTTDGASDIGLTVLSSTFTPTEGVTVQSLPASPNRVRASGLQPTSVNVLNLSVQKRWDGPLNSFAELSGAVVVTPSVDLSLDVDWTGLKGYKFGAGVEVANSLTASVGVEDSASQSFTLGELTQTRGGMIGPVPVWVQATFTLVAEFSESGTVTVTMQESQSGKVSAGLTNTSSTDLAPRAYSTTAKTDSVIASAEAAGQLTGFIGPQVELMLYSLAGPYAKLGARAEATISYTPPTTFTCAIEFGAHAEAGLKTSDALKKLTGQSFGTSSSINFLTTTVSGCPAGTGGGGDGDDAGSDLAIVTSGLASGTVGTAYQETLAATGGTAPYTWTATGLPAGIIAADGNLSGTPNLAGDYPVTLTVTDAASHTASADMTLTVTADSSDSVRAVQIAAGGDHSCALTTAGTVKCWGRLWASGPGDQNYTDYSSPVDVPGVTNVKAIAAGGQHTCALTNTGTVKCWGSNGYGQLGDGTTVLPSQPVDVIGLTDVKAIAAGGQHTCALTNTGTVKCWGYDYDGELGHEDSTYYLYRSSAVDVTAVTDVRSIAAGASHTCALTNTGTVKCWGWNKFGQLGDGTDITRRVAVDVAELSDAAEITAGGRHTCALTTTGTAKCWGYNYQGQLGDGTNTDRYTATEVTGADFKALSAGSLHTCAVTNADTVKCWGDNSQGEIGDGTQRTDRFSPTEIASLIDVRTISAGELRTCALTAAGTAKCWGDNSYGTIGDGSFVAVRLSPTDVIGFG
jgi:alpha-tubulin suppressor-like RCC1 family protein